MTTKPLAARLVVLCKDMWPLEFATKYTAKQADFRDWLNEKTGLNVDHTIDKEVALTAWINKIVEMKAAIDS